MKRIWKNKIRVAGAVQETHELYRCVRRSEGRFPVIGCILDHEILRFAKMILRDRCNTSHDLDHDLHYTTTTTTSTNMLC